MDRLSFDSIVSSELLDGRVEAIDSGAEVTEDWMSKDERLK